MDEKQRQKKMQKREQKRRERLARQATPRQGSGRPDGTPETAAFLTNLKAEDQIPRDCSAWPIIKTYIPIREAWLASGLGAAGIVRQQPDGRVAFAVFTFDLTMQGLKGVIGDYDSTLAEVEEFFIKFGHAIPPYEEGPAALMADYAWGGRALAEASGIVFPSTLTYYYDLLPPPPRPPWGMVQRLTGGGGLTPLALLRFIRENPSPDDLPEGKELALLAEAIFDLTDAQAAAAALRAHPAFKSDGPEEVEKFLWTRELPDDDEDAPPESPRVRQTIGSLTVGKGQLAAAGICFSLTARLIQVLKATIKTGMRLKKIRWQTPHEAARGNISPRHTWSET